MTARIAAAAIALSWLTAFAARADYPERPVRVIVGYTSGETTDLVARIVMPTLTEVLKQAVPAAPLAVIDLAPRAAILR